MKWRADNPYVTGIALILAVPFIWLYAFTATLTPDHALRLLISDIRQRDAETEVYLLRSRSHIDNDFDPLATAQKNMKKTMLAFNVHLIELNTEEEKQARIVHQLYELYDNKLERFKTLHAKLSNSLRFLPKLGKKLREAFDKDKPAGVHDTMPLVDTILTSTFSFRLFGDDSMLVNLHDKVESLKKLIYQQENSSHNELLHSFIRHAEMFLLFREKEAEIVEFILDNQLENELAVLEQKMRERHVMEDELAQKIRYFLIGYSALLFFIILLFIVNRRHLLKSVLTHQMLSEEDQLTGLSNRRHFIKKLNYALHSVIQNQSHGALIFIDLDGFKAVNDNLGHNEGDTVLKIISERLKQQSTANKTAGIEHFVARLGGDEFVILLAGLPKDNIQVILHKVTEQTLQICSQSLGEKYNQFSITASLGVVTFPDQSMDVTDLLHFADLAMYQSKKQGKNCCNFYNTDIYV